MKCPFCGAQETRVVDSRLAAEGYQVRRRRVCNECDERFTTFETAELAMPRVRKTDNTQEPYNEEKLRKSFDLALHKRPVPSESIETAIEHISHKLRTAGEREIDSRKLGEWVMGELRELDHVAYIRFASVYRKFEDVAVMREEIDRLANTPSPELKRQQKNLFDGDEKL